MRRRNGAQRMSAEELVALHGVASEAVADLPREDRARALRRRLRQVGTDSLTCIQADYWIRRGRPSDYSPAVKNGWTS